MISTATSTSTIPKTIIFSQTKNDVYKVFQFLSASSPHKYAIGMYHASQSEETKAFIQSTFRSSLTALRYLSATIAFGMVCVCQKDYVDTSFSSFNIRGWIYLMLR